MLVIIPSCPHPLSSLYVTGNKHFINSGLTLHTQGGEKRAGAGAVEFLADHGAVFFNNIIVELLTRAV
jgi:hypothetical protein